MYVTDTHSFIWFITKDKRLGEKAKEIFRSCDNGNLIVIIPSIVLFECLYICEKKKVDLEFRQIIEKIDGTFNYLVYPLDEEVVLNCQSIKEIVEPHDRIVVATAKLLNATLITKDEKIIDSGLVKTIW
jgi:PIN domain nuclease of toxin-antitoxin system